MHDIFCNLPFFDVDTLDLPGVGINDNDLLVEPVGGQSGTLCFRLSDL